MIETTSVPLYNDATLIRWNMDKRYLEELSAREVGAVSSRTGLFEADDPAAAELARDIVMFDGVAMLQRNPEQFPGCPAM